MLPCECCGIARRWFLTARLGALPRSACREGRGDFLPAAFTPLSGLGRPRNNSGAAPQRIVPRLRQLTSTALPTEAWMRGDYRRRPRARDQDRSRVGRLRIATADGVARVQRRRPGARADRARRPAAGRTHVRGRNSFRRRGATNAIRVCKQTVRTRSGWQLRT